MTTPSPPMHGTPMHGTPLPGERARARGGMFALFVDRPVLTLMVLAATVLIGVLSFSRLPLRFVPEGISSNTLRVWVPVRNNRSPQEVRDTIARPLEELLRTIPGLRSVNSDSDTDSARFNIELDPEMDPTLAAAEVRDRIQRARLEWPPDVDRYFTWKEDGGSAPLAFFRMLTPERNADWDVKIDELVRQRLEGVPGVGRVDVWGLQDETLRIWFDRDKLAAYSVDFRELLERMGSDNFSEPLGEIESLRSRVLVRADTRFRSTREIEDYPVRPGLKVGDIARVERVPSIRDSVSRINGKLTYTGIVRAAADANPVDTMREFHTAADELTTDPRLEGLEFSWMFDQGGFIEDSLDTLLSTALQGGLLALVVLFLFLRNVRMTASIASSIPLTLLIVGGMLYFTGGSMNIASMAGMTLAVGMVVDNAVVVLENIRRFRDQGMPLRQACIKGPREVGLAVTMATLTTVVVFLPMAFMAGEPAARAMFAGVGIPLSTALIGSLFVALLILPAVVRALEARREPAAAAAAAAAAPASTTSPAGTPSRWSPIHWLERATLAPLRVALRYPVAAFFATVTTLVLMMVATAGAFGAVEFSAGGGGGPFRRGDVGINVEFARGMSLGDANQEMLFFERWAKERAEEYRIQSVGSRFSREGGRVDLFLDDEVTAEETKQISARLRENWPRRPGVEVKLRQRGGGGMGGGDTSEQSDNENFVVRLYGRDNDYLMERASMVASALAARAETLSVEVPAMDRQQEVQLQVQRDRLQDLNVRPEALLGALTSGLQGRELSRFEERGREVRLIAQFDSERNPNLKDLKTTQVFSNGGGFQQLDNLANIEFQPTVDEIEAEDGRTSVVVVGKRAADVGPREMSALITRTMERIPLARGYSWSEVSPSRDTEAEFAALAQAGILSIVLVFLLMGVLFESVIRPLAILLMTGPLAMFGAMMSLWAFLGSMDPMAMIGIIILVGVVVNNGIVLLDFVERERRRGRPVDEAILDGVRVRLRPIFMTASTTVVGLLPMAVFGEAGGDGISYVGLSIAVAGGLTLCTVLTPLFVPLAYVFFDFVSRALVGSRLRAKDALRPSPDPSLPAPLA